MEGLVRETPRLYLRHLRESDLGALLTVLGDPEVMRFSVHGALDEAGVRRFLENARKRQARDGFAQWAVVRKDSGECIGECGIAVQTVDERDEHELGYRLARAHWGQGFASEAALACRDHGFGEGGLTRLISIIEAANLASIRVAEKVGLRLEKQALFHAIPVGIYSLAKGHAPRAPPV